MNVMISRLLLSERIFYFVILGETLNVLCLPVNFTALYQQHIRQGIERQSTCVYFFRYLNIAPSTDMERGL